MPASETRCAGSASKRRPPGRRTRWTCAKKAQRSGVSSTTAKASAKSTSAPTWSLRAAEC